MKTFSTITLFVTILLLMNSESKAQTADHVKKKIASYNRKFVQWFNDGEVDSLVSIYSSEACLEGRGCGKDFIRTYYQQEMAQYKLLQLETSELGITENLVHETGKLKIALPSGLEVPMNYTTEWKLIGNRWVIVKDILPVRGE